MISKIEAGESKLQEKDADKIDRAWELGDHLGRIIRLAKSRHDSDWGEKINAIAEVATQARIWSLGWVPALFQTSEYARAAFLAAKRADAEEAVQARIRRQEMLQRTPPPLVRAIIDRSALELPVGGPEVHRAQLERLIAMAADFTIRVVELRAGPHDGRDGSFLIYTTPDGLDHPYTSTVGPGRLIEDPGEIAGYRTSFDRISDKALNEVDSLAVLHKIREGIDG
ncbi:helix-turn-helix transcriptional regulator [Actinomadura vinacea]|uniref:Helix-turn-helix transcriptional regulator n=1 Tax=Actinomadura vinacea TaxID=115336 RepID=A0ABN3JB04_9ACTN